MRDLNVNVSEETQGIVDEQKGNNREACIPIRIKGTVFIAAADFDCLLETLQHTIPALGGNIGLGSYQEE